MAFSPQTFTTGNVLTAAQLNQMDTNIDEVRAQHKGSSPPASPTAGTHWIDDTTAGDWIAKYYDGAAFIPWASINSAGDDIGFLSQKTSSLAGIRITGENAVANDHLGNSSLAQSASVILIPDADITPGGFMAWVSATTNAAAGAPAIVVGVAYTSGGSAAVTTILSSTNIALGYTPNSGVWARNLNASTLNCRGTYTRFR